LTVKLTSWTETKVGLSDLTISKRKGRHLTDKSYSRDNRLISPKSPYRRGGLAPRCRLIASWSWSRFQGLGCSPIKAVRELGSERRETVRSISGVSVKILRRFFLSTRGPEKIYQWCTSYFSKSKRWVAMYKRIITESI